MTFLHEPDLVRGDQRDHSAPSMPPPIGPLTAFTAAVLHDPRRQPGVVELTALAVDTMDPLANLDFQRALYALHELHYRGVASAHPDAEWHPNVVGWWHHIAGRFESALCDAAPLRLGNELDAGDQIADLVEASDGPSLSAYVAEHASLDVLREFAIHRSLYQLKEADPHTFALPRVGGRAKAAFVEIQMDEYGNGVSGRSHAELFAETMRALDLDPTYGRYVAHVPAVTLATVNLITHLALHRRLLGALLGHLALFEMTSVGPMRRYAEAMRSIGAPEEACEFYDVHVVADEHHGPLARVGLVDAHVAEHRDDGGLAVWGAEVTMAIEGRFSELLLDRWSHDESSLRLPA
ncbi:iron-containing redox enzyme family protein [Actinospongicola halichondriae]|uniref:iron-containing redox enzyme family protein n=1 Tax=Actinospongicola halichondriae TaxID=3236844 RepID=UPI003D5892EF